MEHNYIFWGVVGIVSGLVAALADVPLVKPGRPDPDTALLKGKIQTWWADVPSKRFVISFWLSFLGQPGTYIVMWLLAGLISNNNGSSSRVKMVFAVESCRIDNNTYDIEKNESQDYRTSWSGIYAFCNTTHHSWSWLNI